MLLRPLFVAGCQRSGTTAFVEYLNDQPEILVCRERYKYIPRQVTFDHFSFERILDYSESETNMPEQDYAELVARKDPQKLKWIGDKNPDYYQVFERLLEQNPGARFILLYRPLEEVAESFEARAKDPEDRWPAHYDFERSVKQWNLALNRTRKFIESGHADNVLIVSYHDFFYRNETCLPLLSRFLQIELDDRIRESWGARSTDFKNTRRTKNALSAEQVSFLSNNKHHAAEAWILDRIGKQHSNPESIFGQDFSQHVQPSAQPSLLNSKQRIEYLQTNLEAELSKVARLEAQNRRLMKKLRKLEKQSETTQRSKLERLPRTLGDLRSRLSDRKP